MPAAPIVSSITFDQSSYNTGQLMTATVNYVAGESDSTQTFTGQAVDSATGLSGSLTVNFVVADAVHDSTAVAGSDNGNRTWVKISDTGSVAKFTATA